MSVNAGLLLRDVLVEIFSYCSYYDLVESIQYVCRWWKEVSRDKSLWQQIEYRSRKDSKERIIYLFRKSPFLRTVSLSRFLRRDAEIYKELLVNCPYLEVLSISWECVQDAVLNRVITEPLTTIKTLKLDVIENNHIYLRCIHFYFPNVEHLVDDQFNLSRRELDFCWYLREKQDVLHTLSLCCRTEDGNCVLPYLSACTSLKTLTLKNVCGESSINNALRFNTISVLTLHYSSLEVNCLNHFPNVVHLQVSQCIRSVDFLGKLGLCCPALSQLTLRSHYALNHSLRALLSEHTNLMQLNYLKSLTHLCIRYNVQITDKCVEQLKDVPNLIKLDLYACDRVTPMCLKVICTFSKLEVLKFDLKNSTVNLTASDIKNRDLQFMFYNCPRAMLEWFRKQHLRVCFLGKRKYKYL